jgi:hypothetical protein
MARPLRNALVALYAAIAVACSGGDKGTGPNQSIAGRWAGSVEGGASMSLSLRQSGQTVTGDGTLSAPGTSIPLNVDGTFYPSTSTYSLTLKSALYVPAVFSGKVSGDVMTGHLDGSGLTNAAVSLSRQ